MLEELRQDMIEAFKAYLKKDAGKRENDWEFYCKCRENYLQEAARLNNKPYQPLKLTLQKAEHLI